MLLSLLWGCGPRCVDVDETCTPQYEPTFDEVYANTLAPSCALEGCHGSDGGNHGFDLSGTPDEVYATLVEGGAVVPGEPGCGKVVVHIESTGHAQMPPGSPLPDEERCALRTWIADGALR
ncbi:MAG: hypothetical protein H6738_22845 [Alphaproteobacteria bacterium]|nr:hypothetical protein [Alphaproteobacteria bacterium]MCB9699641.1 hypothetical protein [Alphaproteobacteria bacterium]